MILAARLILLAVLVTDGALILCIALGERGLNLLAALTVWAQS